MMNSSFTYLDLFAGCGGISLGLERAGGKLVAAVEKSQMAGETFYRNFLEPLQGGTTWEHHLTLSVEKQARAGLIVGPLEDALNSEQVMEEWSAQEIDVVVGGPPCQGFSLAGRRNARDDRNSLPWQFLDVVTEIEPRIVVMENVVGMGHKFDGDEESVFTQLRKALGSIKGRKRQLGYSVRGLLINANHFGAPQNRPRLMLVALRDDMANQLEDFGACHDIWKSHFADEIPAESDDYLAPRSKTARNDAPTLGDAICDLGENTKPSVAARSDAYLADLATKSRWGLPDVVSSPNGVIKNHEFRKHSARTVTRFRVYQYLRDVGLKKLMTNFATQKIDRGEVEKQLKNVMGTGEAWDGEGKPIAKDYLELSRLVCDLATRKHSQSALDWHGPSRTVVTLPDDYVHPIHPRVLTVREFARVQGFPDDFVFFGKTTTGSDRRRFEVPQYSQVGNAVSPFVGLAIGELIVVLLTPPVRNLADA